MVRRVVDAALGSKAARTIVVVGHEAGAVLCRPRGQHAVIVTSTTDYADGDEHVAPGGTSRAAGTLRRSDLPAWRSALRHDDASSTRLIDRFVSTGAAVVRPAVARPTRQPGPLELGTVPGDPRAAWRRRGARGRRASLGRGEPGHGRRPARVCRHRLAPGLRSGEGEYMRPAELHAKIAELTLQGVPFVLATITDVTRIQPPRRRGEDARARRRQHHGDDRRRRPREAGHRGCPLLSGDG